MKVYGCPAAVPWADPDYANYDPKKERKREAEHEAKLKEWLIKAGYTGQHTGKILSEPMADGYANYMMADGYANYMMADGKKPCLIHLPYGDAWDNKNVEFLPKAEVIKRIQRREGLASIFSAKKAS